MQVHPAGPARETKVVLAGRVSLRVIVLAEAGPPLATVCENVMFCPAFTGFGLPAFVMLRSAWVALATAMIDVAELLLEFVS